jgi:hypothetical protein
LVYKFVEFDENLFELFKFYWMIFKYLNIHKQSSIPDVLADKLLLGSDYAQKTLDRAFKELPIGIKIC